MSEDEAIEILKVAERTKCNGDTYATSELNAIETILDLYNKTKEDESRYYYEWKHLEANIINKINELEEINMDVFTFEIAEDLKRLLEEN